MDDLKIERLTAMTKDFNEVAKLIIEIMKKTYYLMKEETDADKKINLQLMWTSIGLMSSNLDEVVKIAYPLLFSYIERSQKEVKKLIKEEKK